MTYEYRKIRYLSNKNRLFCKTNGFCFAKLAFYARQACLFCTDARQRILFCKNCVLCKTNVFVLHGCKTKGFVLQKLRFMQDKRVCFARMQDKGFCFAKFAFCARQTNLMCMSARQEWYLLLVCCRENAVEGGILCQVNNLHSILTKNRTQNARSTRLMQKRRFMAANSFLSSGAASRRMPMTSWRAGLGAVQ